MSFPSSLIFFLKDLLQTIKWFFPGEFIDDKKNNLSFNQIYPNGKNIIKLFEVEAKNLLFKIDLKKNHKISSIGTCFAEEVSYYFDKSKEYNYFKLEDNFFNFSANWGRVYTIKNLHQIIRYSLSDSTPTYIEEYKGIFFDPLREYSVGSYKDVNILKNTIKNHRSKSKEIFNKTDLLIITLGQNEFWYDKNNHIAWGRTPPLSMRIKSKRFSAKEYSYDQNLEELKSSIELIRMNNPKIKILFTISPVPQYATFTSQNIISKAFYAKCLLRSVVNEIINLYEQIYYFPSFEFVLAQNNASFNSDNRHIKRKKVSKIMDLITKSLKR